MHFETMGPSGDSWIRESWTRTESHAFISAEGSVKRRGPEDSAASKAGEGVLSKAVAVLAAMATAFLGAIARRMARMPGRRPGRLTVVKPTDSDESSYACSRGRAPYAAKPESLLARGLSDEFGQIRSADVRSRGA